MASRWAGAIRTLTEAGEAELRSWATTAWVRAGGFRDELFLKLLGASALGPQALTTLIEAQRQTYLSELGAWPASAGPTPTSRWSPS
ncbi:hypothetical protein [Streptomyces sp900105755]|uniref:Uncharacterized protein n=1 Tax=Streptomyces sp. 900105755 TaxID=3154389 RepID=A0ABV1TEP9_9ACTN